jgi:membrane-bound lytic murein transglycosylase B
VLPPWIDPAVLDPDTAAKIASNETLDAALEQPPAWLIPIYKAAGDRYHIPWRVLAAINAVETDYGRNLHISKAGAMGWMQFEPKTWRRYGVSIDGLGAPNVYDPLDAIFTAARYLAASGGTENLRQAIFAYNHALWYVDVVLWRAQFIGTHPL